MTDAPKAFPRAATVPPADAIPFDYGNEGMDLRDWFAGQALTGLLAGRHPVCTKDDNELLAACAYAIADAMMVARQGGAA
jgi:hypothetical protein